MKDPDKQETGIFVLVLIAMAAGILVGFYLGNNPLPQGRSAATPSFSTETPNP